MSSFYKICEEIKINQKTGKIVSIKVYPDFNVLNPSDLMIRSHLFYAIWDEERGLWSTSEWDASEIIDKALQKYADELAARLAAESEDDVPKITIASMKRYSSGSWSKFKKFISDMPDNAHNLDDNLTFLNTPVKQTDYVSKRLPYNLESGDYSAWDELVGLLYEPKEREKIEWAIGSVISGDSKIIQKFFVFYGAAGTGKSTIINIIERLLTVGNDDEGNPIRYYTSFDSKALGSASNNFATEAFRGNPLVAIQHDGDLSKIDDNTRINSIVSHEMMSINVKNKSMYTARSNCMLFMGTNSPVKITDAKSGIKRRLIDIVPSGKTFPPKKYDALMSQIDFQLGAIAYHCLEVYRSLGKNYYKNYEPISMMSMTNSFFSFLDSEFEKFASFEKGVSLTQAYDIYTEYATKANYKYKLPRNEFEEELKSYYREFYPVTRIDGKQYRKWYKGFITEKFEPPVLKREEHSLSLVMDCVISLLDDVLADCPAQYATEDEDERPLTGWDNVKTTLKDLDPKRLHYILPKFKDENHLPLIMIDFDLKNENGEKDMLLNMEAASKFPKTYSEFSKGGAGIHLFYWYNGDISKLAIVYSPGIEIKIFRGKSAIRRRLSKCNNIPIQTLGEGALPMKEENMISIHEVKDINHLRNKIAKSLRKEDNVGGTKCEIDFIKDTLDRAYVSGMTYDVSDMAGDIFDFAKRSTNHKDYCIHVATHEMKYRSKDFEQVEEMTGRKNENEDDAPIWFYDCEVKPNLFFISCKEAGKDKPFLDLYNPSPHEVAALFDLNLADYNGLRYDRPIMYHRYLGNSISSVHEISHNIVSGKMQEIPYPEARNIGYIDVFDMLTKKQSLKKWEIELHLPHKEMDGDWDEPIPEERWGELAEYCHNDVLALEAVFNSKDGKRDFTTRKILARLTGLKVNSTTNQHSAKFIFGDNRNPQSEFNYRFMGDESDVQPSTYDLSCDQRWTVFDSKGRPIFPGYTFDPKKPTKERSMYRGEYVGEGGYVYAEPGIHRNVALLDIASMHPSSIIAEVLFGLRYTARFKEIVDLRIAIKHKNFDKARHMLDGMIAEFLEDESVAKDLAQALKIVINSVYGLTSANFPNAFRDPRNKDNIVAKRGALFMINLKHEVQSRGFTVAHIKTDSIKIPDATPEIIQFVMDYGKLYGYNFEHEATYDRMCLVNDAVYIAKYDTKERCETRYGYIPEKNGDHGGEWTATGAQFQHPYVFKTLFSGEPLEFYDYCETKSVTGDSAMYLDMNETLLDVADAEEELTRRVWNTEHDDKKKRLNPDYADYDDQQLKERIALGHDYHFVGRVGSFYPIRENAGGGDLMVKRGDKYSSVSGTKGFRWLEADTVKELGKESDIDPRYHDSLVDSAIKTIEKYGNYDEFAG